MTYPTKTAAVRFTRFGSLRPEGLQILPPEKPVFNPVINDIPRKNIILPMAADSKRLRLQVIVLHRLIPGDSLFGHIQKDRGQPAVATGKDGLEQNLVGTVAMKMDIGLSGQSLP
jgi:hypothetical protein